MIYTYLIISAALIPILDNFFDILKQPNSWWLVPLLFFSFFVGFVLLQFAVLMIMVFTTDLNKSPDKGAKFFRALLKSSLAIIVKTGGVKINAIGTEKLPQEGRMLFVCNHQHDFDPAVILSVFPDSEIGFIGKKDIYVEKPIIARFMHRIHSLPIDREHDREAAKTVIQAIKQIKDNKVSMAVFPEGYTSPTCELLPLRNGCFKIATKANVPIVVCVINNTQSIPDRLFRKKSEVEFRLLDVIYPEQYEGMNTTQIGDIVYEKMYTALKEIRG